VYVLDKSDSGCGPAVGSFEDGNEFFGFSKMLESSGVAEQLVAFQERLNYMVSVQRVDYFYAAL
jgi:hypothetical protein